MKKVFLLLIVFAFIYPVFPKFAPIPIDRGLQIGGAIVLLFHPNDLTKIFRSRVFYKFYFFVSSLLLLAAIAQLQLSSGFELYFFKEVIDSFFLILSAYLIVWMMYKTYGYYNLGLFLYYVCLTAILQTIISFLFFFNSSLFDLYISLLKEETNQGLISRVSAIGRRFIGFGSQFFSGVMKFGFAFLSILILPYVHSCRLTKNKLFYWLAVVIIMIGGVFTGRTFFVAVVLGVLMITLFKSINIFSFLFNNIKALMMFVVTLACLYLFISAFIEPERLDAMFNFAFELFINFFENDSLETTSTNTMQEMYIFPDNINTWIFGDGRMMAQDGGYYMGTDIGYIRLLFYFGLPSTLFFTYVLFKMYKILSEQTVLKAMKYLFFFFTLWILILNFKGLVYEVRYFVAFLLFFIFDRKYKIEDKMSKVSNLKI